MNLYHVPVVEQDHGLAALEAFEVSTQVIISNICEKGIPGSLSSVRGRMV